MTQLLAAAFEKAQELVESEQDAIASIILAHLADNHAWDESFARSQDVLAKLADQAEAEIAAGQFRTLRRSRS